MLLSTNKYLKQKAIQVRIIAMTLLILSLLANSDRAQALSSQAKSNQLHRELLTQLRNIHTIMANFGKMELRKEDKDLIFGKYYPEYEKNYKKEREFNSYIEDKKERQAFNFQQEYKEAKKLFDRASIHHFGREFLISERMFRQVKWKLIKIWKGMSFIYIKRAKNILDKASYSGLDKLIEFGKENDKTRLFFIAYDPKNDTLMYNPKDYFYLFAKGKINQYLKEGYKQVYLAKKLFGYRIRYIIKDKDGNVIPERKSETDTLEFKEYLHNYEYNLERDWIRIINLTRQAKIQAFEVFRMLNRFRYSPSIQKYGIKFKKVESFYDDRIPDQFQLDYLDSLHRIHQEDIRLFEQHLISRGVDHKRYLREEDNYVRKISGYQDKFPVFLEPIYGSTLEKSNNQEQRQDKANNTNPKAGEKRPAKQEN